MVSQSIVVFGMIDLCVHVTYIWETQPLYMDPKGVIILIVYLQYGQQNGQQSL